MKAVFTRIHNQDFDTSTLQSENGEDAIYPYVLCYAYIEKGDFEFARNILDNLNPLDPDEKRIKQILNVFYLHETKQLENLLQLIDEIPYKNDMWNMILKVVWISTLINNDSNTIDTIEKNLKSAFQDANNSDYLYFLGKLHNLSGYYYFKMNQFNKARIHFLKGYNINLRFNRQQDRSYGLLNLASCYKQKYDYNQTVTYLNKLNYKSNNDIFVIYHLELSDLMIKTKKYHSALGYLTVINDFCNENNMASYLVTIFDKLGLVYYHLGFFEKTLYYFEKMLETTNNLLMPKVHVQIKLAWINYIIGNYEKASNILSYIINMRNLDEIYILQSQLIYDNIEFIKNPKNTKPDSKKLSIIITSLEINLEISGTSAIISTDYLIRLLQNLLIPIDHILIISDEPLDILNNMIVHGSMNQTKHDVNRKRILSLYNSKNNNYKWILHANIANLIDSDTLDIILLENGANMEDVLYDFITNLSFTRLEKPIVSLYFYNYHKEDNYIDLDPINKLELL